jgi:hypothetical protein
VTQSIFRLREWKISLSGLFEITTYIGVALGVSIRLPSSDKWWLVLCFVAAGIAAAAVRCELGKSVWRWALGGTLCGLAWVVFTWSLQGSAWERVDRFWLQLALGGGFGGFLFILIAGAWRDSKIAILCLVGVIVAAFTQCCVIW